MPAPNVAVCLTLLAALLTVTRAEAQTLLNSGSPFVNVTVGADWDDVRSESTRASGATWRAGLAFGVDWGRSGIEIGVSLPQSHVRTHGPHRYQYAGPTFLWHQQGHFYESSSTVRRRSPDVSVLYRANIPVNRHVTFTWLAGAGYVYRREQVTSVTAEFCRTASAWR
jgi:hypothetical protein